MAAPTLPLVILRPEPGASATAARAEAIGLSVIKCPSFAVEPVAWDVPDPRDFDCLLLTSANAVRHAGPGMRAFAHLPCWCVGEATAAAARGAGLLVERTGTGDATMLLADIAAPCRMLWLLGENHSAVSFPAGVTAEVIVVYRAMSIAADPQRLSEPAVVLVHSERAARRLAQLAPYKSQLSLVAISPAVAAAAGPGWREIRWSNAPQDSEMLAIAAKLCHDGAKRPQRNSA